MAKGNVTVTRKGRRFVSSFSVLPDRTFGPYEFAEMVRDLRISALLSARAARDLVIDASTTGSATAVVGGGK